MTENTERFAAFIADTMVRLSRGVPLAVMRNGDGRWLRVRLDGSGESNATLAMAATNGTLVGVYNIRCPRQWLEEDVRRTELRKLEQELAEFQRRLLEMESWVDRHAGERFWVPA